MKNVILIIISIFTLVGCSSDDEDFLLEGETFVLTSYKIESPVDLNGDGVFSTELLNENNCVSGQSLRFQDGKVDPVLDILLTLDVGNDNNNNLIQIASCLIIDYVAKPQYDRNGNTVTIAFEGSDVVHAIGQIIGNTIQFSVEAFSSNQILNSDGSITDYSGLFELTYERVE